MNESECPRVPLPPTCVATTHATHVHAYQLRFPTWVPDQEGTELPPEEAMAPVCAVAGPSSTVGKLSPLLDPPQHL